MKRLNKKKGSSRQYSSRGDEGIDKLVKSHYKFLSLNRNAGFQLPNEMIRAFNKRAETLIACYENQVKSIKEEAGMFLHNLDDRKHTEQSVQKVIEMYPEALKYKRDKRFPIQTALFSSSPEISVSFIPLLAQEAIRHRIFDRKDRGGLCILDEDRDESLILHQLMTREAIGDKDLQSAFDLKCIRVCESLRAMNLFCKDDIHKFGLLYASCNEFSPLRFRFIVDWDPTLLMKPLPGYDTLPLQHFAENEEDEIYFKMILEAGMKYYPEKFGHLFKKDMKGKHAFEVAIHNHGINKTLKCVRGCILPCNENTILHHVMKRAPSYLQAFIYLYPHCIFVRNKRGRLLFHSFLAHGRSLKSDSIFLVRSSDFEISERDPKTGLFPFMLAARGKMSDLDTIYYLLRRNPNVNRLFDSNRPQVITPYASTASSAF